ncbi:MAG: hypothetical protein U0800_09945 [Isosphaeraceae bacterium]
MDGHDSIDFASKIAAKGGRRERARRPLRSQELLATQILGGSSMSIGFLVLAATISGLSGYSFDGNARATHVGIYSKLQSIQVLKLETGQFEDVTVPVYTAGRQVFVPGEDMLWLPMSGWVLGLIGMIVGGSLRRISWWSTIGLAANTATMLLVVCSAQYLHLMP